MQNFLFGLIIGLIGFLLWFVSSFVAGTSDFLGVDQPWFGKPLMLAGFLVMWAGPVIFWIILPVIKFLVRRRG